MRGSELDAVLNNPMARRAFLKSMAVVGGTGVLAACRRESPPGGGTATGTPTDVDRPPLESEPGVLSIYEWAGYESKWIWKEYRDKGYADPKFSFYTNTEQAIAKTAGGYTWDIAHPENGYLQDYKDLGSIQPWDTSLIPNHADLNPLLTASAQIDGQQYGIALDWGYSGVIIRTDHVDPEINSYSYLFDDALEGRIAWFDTPWLLLMAGLVLGVESDIFDMTPDDLTTCKEYCIEKKKNLHNIWVDYTQMWDDVRTGTIWAAYSWPDTYVVLKEEAPVQYIRPKEGTMAWVESLVLYSDTENYHHAHEYADAWASVGTGEKLIINWGYGHSNLNVDLSKMDPDVVSVFGLDTPMESLAEPQSHLDRYQPQRAAYNRAWDEVKAA